MITAKNISSISDLRFKTKEVLKKAQKSPVYVFSRNTPRGVLLSYENYQELLSALEDHYDSLLAQEYEKEDKNKVKWITHEEIKKMLHV
ncbi:MAG TPA: type II toxin-antitoxin system prevent-host-death family antitoxin [Patescibacteria group bacterium]|nr:type II toxin-antitoxin system prevent-host-death family antitoxin [Patescibacteria group bacterium]